MTKLETIEWCNYWWEQADDQSAGRVLLIGDSITQGYRPHVNRLMDGVCCDMMAGSRGADNPGLVREIDHILNHGYTYRAIHFNNGLHGWHIETRIYRDCISALIEHIMSGVPGTPLILGLSTPKTLEGRTGVCDPEYDGRLRERNDALRFLAGRYGLPLTDLYTPMLNKPEFLIGDGYHFNENGQRAQARIVTDMLKKHMVMA